jgi:lambda family phage portal protein
MSLIERAITALSPHWGLRRSVARAQLGVTKQVEKRQVARQRYADNWNVNDTRNRGATAPGRALTASDRAKLRRLFRLNPFARKLKATLLNNLVSYGITATPKGTKRLQQAWKEWVPKADFDEVQDIYGLQELAIWTMLLDGEAFVVKRLVSIPAMHPLRLQVLSIDQLDLTVVGERVRDGIEFGADDKPAFYHFKSSLDPMFAFTGRSSSKYPAADVIHLFRREEPGQWRGRSHFEAVIEAINDVDDYIEAEGVRKKLESCFAAFVERSIDAEADDRPVGDTAVPGNVGLDEAEPRIEGFYPGMVSYLDQGETVKFGEPKAAGGFAEYLRWGNLRVAAGGEVTYEGLTGDLSNVNFSSYRAGANEFESGMGRIQWLTIIPQLCERVADWWKEAAFATGRISSRDARAEFKHTPPRVKTIDRMGDAKAAEKEMEIGIESRRNLVAERGNDHDQLMDEIAADRAANEKRGVAFKGDPTTPGASNASDPTGKSGDASDGADDVPVGGDATGVV